MSYSSLQLLLKLDWLAHKKLWLAHGLISPQQQTTGLAYYTCDRVRFRRQYGVQVTLYLHDTCLQEAL